MDPFVITAVYGLTKMDHDPIMIFNARASVNRKDPNLTALEMLLVKLLLRILLNSDPVTALLVLCPFVPGQVVCLIVTRASSTFTRTERYKILVDDHSWMTGLMDDLLLTETKHHVDPSQ